jgi:hypothetical protein
MSSFCASKSDKIQGRARFDWYRRMPRGDRVCGMIVEVLIFERKLCPNLQKNGKSGLDP